MKKIISLITLFLVLGVVGISGCISSGSSDSASETPITGVYNTSGVYFVVPDGWNAYKETYSESVPLVAQAAGNNVRLYVYRYNGTYETAKEVANTQAEHFRYWNNDPIVTSAYINGDKGYSVFGYESNEEQYEDHYIVEKGNYIYDLTFSMDSNTDDAIQAGIAVDTLSSPEVHKVLDSFNA